MSEYTGLLNFNPDDPATLSLLAMNSEQVAPGLAAPDQPPPAAPAAPPADAGGPGFWSRLGSGFTDVTSGIGEALGGGLDPSITGGERTNAGIRALMSASVNMLANSGPSYTPRNFGQIAAASLAAAGETNQLAELNQFRRDQSKATIAMRRQQLAQQGLMSRLALAKFLEDQKSSAELRELIRKQLNPGGDGAPPTGEGATAPTGAGPVTPEVQADFVNKGAPLWADIAQKTGLPVDVVAGLSAHETAWGTSPAAQKGNLFGISANEKPLTYASPMEGATAFVNLMNSDRYKGVDRSGSPEEVLGRLAKAGYNTADPDYAKNAAQVTSQVARLRSPGQPAPVQTAGPGVPTGPATPPPAPAATPPAPATTPPAPTGDTTAAPATPPPAPAATPPAPAAAPAATPAPPLPKPSDTEVPPPDLSRIAKERAEAAKAYRTDLAAAAALSHDPKAAATAIAAATDKKRTQDAAIADAEAKERADYNKRLGEWQTKERQRAEDVATKRADEAAKLEAQHKQAMELQEAQAKAKLAEIDRTSGNTRVNKRLDESEAASQAATSMLQAVDKLDLVVPALLKGGPDPLAERAPQLREVARFLLGDKAKPEDIAKWNAQDAYTSIVSELVPRLQQGMKGSVSDYEGRQLAGMIPGLAKDPKNLPIVLGLIRATNLRITQMHQAREDFAGKPENQGKTEGMENAAWQKVSPGWKENYPPPLFPDPPPLEQQKLIDRGGGTPEEWRQAKWMDRVQQDAWANDDKRPKGMPFKLWTRDGSRTRWAVLGPDGKSYTEPE